MGDPIQIDPPGCGCTECLTGLYVPLDRATDEQVMGMLCGGISNATSDKFTLTTVITDYLGSTGTTTQTVTAEYYGRTWEWVLG
jgi:hypothetical protein